MTDEVVVGVVVRCGFGCCEVEQAKTSKHSRVADDGGDDDDDDDDDDGDRKSKGDV
jgi:hypothetical protein